MANPSLLAVVMAVLYLSPVIAAAQSQECARIASPTERLACHDAAFPPIIDPQAQALEKEQALKEFGLSEANLRERDPDRKRALVPSRIHGTVASVTYRSDDRRVVTLDNGQVWALTQATSLGPLKTGDRVEVRTAALGTYMLVSPSGVPLRVRRVN